MPVALTGALKAIHRAVCAARGAGDALRVLDFACGYGAIGGIVAPRRPHAGDLRPVWRAPLAHGRCPEPWGGGCRFFCRPARGIRGVRDWRYGHRRGRSRVRGRLGTCRSDLSRGPRRRRPERGIEAISGRCDPCIASRFQYRTKGGVSTKCRTQTQNYLDFHSWVGANKKPRDSIHQGIDIAGRSGQRVIAIVDGLVVETHVEKCWGPTVVIDHGIDKDGKPLIALYGHVGKFLVREGQTVSRGDVIARLGNNQRKFKCMFRVRHLHLQLGRIRRLVKGTYWGHAYFLLDAFNAVNPHLLWADGPYRVTCLDKKRRYPRGTLTYPMPCG